jgi:hypothetical protein
MYKNRIGGIRCRTSEQLIAKSISIKGTGCKFGGCVRKAVELTSGDLPFCRGITTEGRAIDPDRAAEVSRGRSRRENAEGPNGPRKGLMGAASKQRDS